MLSIKRGGAFRRPCPCCFETFPDTTILDVYIENELNDYGQAVLVMVLKCHECGKRFKIIFSGKAVVPFDGCGAKIYLSGVP